MGVKVHPPPNHRHTVWGGVSGVWEGGKVKEEMAGLSGQGRQGKAC